VPNRIASRAAYHSDVPVSELREYRFEIYHPLFATFFELSKEHKKTLPIGAAGRDRQEELKQGATTKTLVKA
jgi:hypothetical protein